MRPLPILMMILLLVAAAGCGGPKEQVHPLETGGVDALDYLKVLHARTTRILGEVTGAKAAAEVLPELEAVSADYDALIKQASTLSPGPRQELAEEAARILPGLKANARRLGAMKGTGELLTPVLQELADKVARLT
jgi:hypothetical protein